MKNQYSCSGTADRDALDGDAGERERLRVADPAFSTALDAADNADFVVVVAHVLL